MSAKKHNKRTPVRQVAKPSKRTSLFALMTVTVAAFLAAYLAYGWVLQYPLVVVPLVVGGAIALCTRTREESAVSGLIAGILAAVFAYASYSIELMSNLYTATEQATHWMNFDIPPMTYRLAAMALSNNPASWSVTGAGTSSAAFASYLASGAGVGLVAFGVSYLLQRFSTSLGARRSLVAWALVVVTAGSLYASIITVASLPSLQTDSGEQFSFMQNANVAPQDGQYAFDGAIYKRAYYEMLKGTSYYNALPIAANGDSRLQGKGAVKNGKFYSWAYSPAFIRPPLAFYLWKYAAPGGGAGVVYLAAIVSALLLMVVYWGLQPHLEERGIFVICMALPYLLWLAIGLNIFFPDYWAALAATAGVAVLLRRQWIAAGVFATLAALFRETLVFWPLILTAAAVYFWLRGGRTREWTVRVVALAAMSALFFVAYWLHLQAGAAVIGKASTSASSYILERIGSTFTWKVLQPTYYLMWPYGFLRFPGTVLWFLGPIGLWFAARSREERWAAAAFGAFWVAWFVVMGASSSYWGQYVMPSAIVGSAVLVATADRLQPQVREALAELGKRSAARKAASAAAAAPAPAR